MKQTDGEIGRSEYCNDGNAKAITKNEQYKIDEVVRKMSKNAESRDIIYQFAMGIN